MEEYLSINVMKSQGYTIDTDFPWNHETTLDELIQIKSKCSPQTVLCAGGAATNSDTLLLVSCGDCLSVLKPTEVNKPVLNNGAYWYFTNGYSFGFSPNSSIYQNLVDFFDCIKLPDWICTDNKRLSWHVGTYSGYRLGKITTFEPIYRKIIFLK